MKPHFRRHHDGSLNLSDTVQASIVKRENKERGWTAPISPGMVAAAAAAAVRKQGGDTENVIDVLGEYTLQFGALKGQTFRWVLENALGYAGYLVSASESETSSSSHNSKNEESFIRYVGSFPEGREATQQKRPTPSRLSSLVKGPALPPHVLASKIKNVTAERKIKPSVIAEIERRQAKKFAGSTEGSKGTSTVEPPKALSVPAPFIPRINVGETKKPPHPKSSSAPVSRGMDFQTPPPPTLAPEPAPIPQKLQQLPRKSTAQTPSSAPVSRDHQLPEPSTPASISVSKSSRTITEDVPIPHLLAGWERTLPQVDKEWITKALFKEKGYGSFDESRVDQLWWYPPQARLVNNVLPNVDRYFAHSLFLWMPRKLWKARLICPYPSCHNKELVSGGIHPRVRKVLGVSSFYLIAAEDLQCPKCRRKVVSWSHNIVNQLDIGHRLQFPCILTGRNGCDMQIVRLLRNRGLGNSCGQIQKKIEEQHSDAWLQKTIHFLTDCKGFSAAVTSGLVTTPSFDVVPSMEHIPKSRWLMNVYIQDVLQRMEELKASITSQFGSILKMDSTKKVVKKLSGPSAGTAMWFTNIGNEYNQVIMSVLTTHEGYGLADMADCLVKRYSDAGMTPPTLLYVDRDCCGSSSVRRLFRNWPNLQLKLDIWHFMRRISTGCTTDSHMLYAMFMGRLSHCIFEWDQDDLEALKTAKRNEMLAEHISNPSDSDVMSRLNRKQLALHCRRTTRGAQETITLITQLIEAFEGDNGKDTLGVPLINSDRMREIWRIQKKHVQCIQDPSGSRLYIQTGKQLKFGVELPTYRCARGSTSLENFHLHLNRFIPGTLARDTLYQAYIVDGLARWNQDRAEAATINIEEQSSLQHQHSYSGLLRHTANKLSEQIIGRPLTNYTGPRQYTGELIGLEYLYNQKDVQMHDYNAIIDELESGTEEVTEDDGDDEGFADDGTEGIDDYTIPTSTVYTWNAPVQSRVSAQPVAGTDLSTHHEPEAASEHPPPRRKDIQKKILPIPSTEEYQSTIHEPEIMAPVTQSPPPPDQEDSSDKDESVGPDNIPGYDRICALADCLVDLRDHSIALANSEADEIIQLWEALPDYDRLRTKFPARHRSYQIKGRFRSTKTNVSPGVESTRRSALGPNSGPAQWPDCNRYVEAVMLRLCMLFQGSTQVQGVKKTRWTAIRLAYNNIRQCILNNGKVLENTDLQLPEMNQATITQWYNKHGKRQERTTLQQGVNAPEPAQTSAQRLPPPIELERHLPTGQTENPHQFPDPPSTVGTVKIKRRRLSLSPAGSDISSTIHMTTTYTQTSPEKASSIPVHVPVLTGPIPTPTPTFAPTPAPPSAPAVRPALAPTPVPLLYLNPSMMMNMVPSIQQPPSAVPQQAIPSPVPYSTTKYREKKRQDEEQGIFRRKYQKKTTKVTCGKCKQERATPLHQQYFGNWYCQVTSTESLEEWKASLMSRGYGKKRGKKDKDSD